MRHAQIKRQKAPLVSSSCIRARLGQAFDVGPSPEDKHEEYEPHRLCRPRSGRRLKGGCVHDWSLHRNLTRVQ